MNNFTKFIAAKGKEHWRDMPWRDDTRPYYVLVSELMLQQTQVGRVVPKFEEFIKKFPNESILAQASLADVLQLWQGLGYNRRAKYLHNSARMIVSDYGGIFPHEEQDILRLPGVGKNTCGAIAAYAYNRPVMFVETNIRTVYIHHFFGDQLNVSDAQIINRMIATVDQENPRRFYQALMDYGSWLKSSGVHTNFRSSHYKKQAKLEGSLREMRGSIIRLLSDGNAMPLETLKSDARFDSAVDSLLREGMVERTDNMYQLTR